MNFSLQSLPNTSGSQETYQKAKNDIGQGWKANFHKLPPCSHTVIYENWLLINVYNKKINNDKTLCIMAYESLRIPIFCVKVSAP